MMDSVYITGLGAITPFGSNFQETWHNLKGNQSGISHFPTDKVRYLGLKGGGIIYKNQDSFEGLEPWIDRYLALADHSLTDALQSANLNAASLQTCALTVVGATTAGGLATVDQAYDRFISGGKMKVSPYLNINTQTSTLSSYIARRVKSPNTVCLTINAACASAIYALQVAYERILSKRCDVAIVTLAESPFNRLLIKSFQSLGAISEEHQCRPFDVGRDGLVLSEGAATIILESGKHALQRNAPLYGEIVNISTAMDYHNWMSPHPSGNITLKTMVGASQGIKFEEEGDIYINAHGTGTKIGDAAELNALNGFSGKINNQCYFSSTKGHTGHMLTATGLLEVMFTAYTLRENHFIKTQNLEKLDAPLCNPNLQHKATHSTNFTLGISNSIGFGGFTGSIAIKAVHGPAASFY